MRIGARMALLVGLWLLAWGKATLANVLSGILVAAALLLAFPLTERAGAPWQISPIGVARLGGHVLVQLLVSNVAMVGQILKRRPDLRPGVLVHQLRRPSAEVVTIMSSVIALSPGTMTVDVDREASAISVHFFRLDDELAARAGLVRLERLVERAIAAPLESP